MGTNPHAEGGDPVTSLRKKGRTSVRLVPGGNKFEIVPGYTSARISGRNLNLRPDPDPPVIQSPKSRRKGKRKKKKN